MIKNNQIKALPNKPGLYFFKDSAGVVLYVGKAVNLRNRVRSYLKNQAPRIIDLMAVARKVDFQETNSDIEALIVEAQLIKKLRPKFNVLMRDDKQYFYIVISKDKFPKIFLTHQSKGLKKVGAKTILGPFTSGQALKATLKILRKTFPYCTCTQKHHRPCLNSHLNNCVGFCCLRESSDSFRVSSDQKRRYQRNILAVRDILLGKRTNVVKKLEKERDQAVGTENLKLAAILQKQIEQINRIFLNAQAIKKIKDDDRATQKLEKELGLKGIARIEGYDISNIQGTNATGSMVVFEEGQPNKSEYKKFKIRDSNSPDDTGMLAEILARRFQHKDWLKPDLVFIDGGISQINSARKIVPKDIPIISLGKGKEELFYSNPLKNSGQQNRRAPAVAMRPLVSFPSAVQNLIRHIDAEAHRFAISYYRQLHRRAIR
ncbi:MAG: hypothetical protein COV31_00640 [Candidatus Yanofskybacteria bacterium CG10_big_fil_rev_8_21_14_0_10_46_23]|uniref:Excinuclease ABC subunit C n=1 Tax=Candidatus Yanofskybacteria bacterium CG10_big_fil_rev_8_21_14_0_10_46_23 TaxID=1975098 RepID=A0A2H0R546_9BACT|nr:MAG: hypothetical protein COV31_00640 [Candidatus Yanofskybacteria bacterium CG10_big_fil_rev_8_21_14_0_10_46_23]